MLLHTTALQKTAIVESWKIKESQWIDIDRNAPKSVIEASQERTLRTHQSFPAEWSITPKSRHTLRTTEGVVRSLAAAATLIVALADFQERKISPSVGCS